MKTEIIDPRVPHALPPDIAVLKAFNVWRLVYKDAPPGKAKPKKPSKVPFYANGTPRGGDQGSEADRAQLPLYHNGTPRPCWADLPDYAQWSWNGNPTVPARRVSP